MTHPQPIHRASMALVLLTLPLVACMTAGDGSSDESNQALSTGKTACELNSRTRCHQDADPKRQGVKTCVAEGGVAQWSSCVPDTEAPGANDCSKLKTSFGQSFWNGECCVNEYGCCPGDECNTPLVVAFGSEPVRYDSAPSSTTFNLSPRGMSQMFDWPTSVTPWLALDRDGNGRIDGGNELFGSATVLSDGTLAKNGFAALADFDKNDDGRIDAADAVWSRLVLWRDSDGDRRSQTGELVSVIDAGLAVIDLGYRIAPRCDARGNCEVERAELGYRDPCGRQQIGSVIDVRLAVH